MSKWFSVNQGNDCVFHKITAEQKHNLNLTKHTLSDWPVLSLAMSPCALTTGKKEKTPQWVDLFQKWLMSVNSFQSLPLVTTTDQ